MKKHYLVGLYNKAHWVTDVEFKYRWQARLFHWILNKSFWHMGTRGY